MKADQLKKLLTSQFYLPLKQHAERKKSVLSICLFQTAQPLLRRALPVKKQTYAENDLGNTFKKYQLVIYLHEANTRPTDYSLFNNINANYGMLNIRSLLFSLNSCKFKDILHFHKIWKSISSVETLEPWSLVFNDFQSPGTGSVDQFVS